MSDRPKRPLSSYMLWLMSAREAIKRQNQTFTSADVAIRAREIWRTMEDKSIWEDQAAMNKKEYDRAIKELKEKENGGNMSTRGGVKRRLPQEPTNPNKKRKEK